MQKSENSGRISWALALTLVVLMIAAVTLVVFLRLESWPARTAEQSTSQLERIGRDLRSAFVEVAHLQPRITIDNRVYLEQTMPTTELVIVSRRVEVEHEFQNTWIGSSKRVKLHGTFLVKAGFDLHRGVSVDVKPDEIVVRLPHAQILGVEQKRLDVLAFENGIWNRISAADVQKELSVLPDLARQRAEKAGLTAEAEHVLQQQLQARIHVPQPFRLIFTPPEANETSVVDRPR
jgi:Protein of unknown function (DUF4230)